MRIAWATAVVTLATATAAWADPAFERKDLVSDTGVDGTKKDPNLVNAWGLASSPTSPWWVADNGSNKATLYNGDGDAQPLIVDVPGSPTGLVFNGANDEFEVFGQAAPFIFATEDGTILAWQPHVPPDPPHSVAVVHDGGREGDVYKGLALAKPRYGGARLYATDFHNARVVVLDDRFHEVELGEEAFDDDRLPCGYAPFGIAAFGERIFVTYALQDKDKHDDVAGPGHGFIDEYDLDGRFIRRVASGGVLNSPWGLAIGPESFGHFDDALLVGNFGDGHINAFKRGWFGHFYFAGALRDERGHRIKIDGLWSIKPGNDHGAGSSQELFFTAGPGDEKHGLFGLIKRARW